MINYRLGSHVSIEKTLLQTLKNLNEHAKCCQFHLGSPQSYKPRTLSESDIEESVKYCVEKEISFLVHSPYTINLCRKDLRSPIVELCNNVVRQLSTLPGRYVIHAGSGDMKEQIESLNSISFPENLEKRASILIENCVGAGKQIGKNGDEMRKTFECIDNINHFGMCFDTQHSFAAGWLDFSKTEEVAELFNFCDDYSIFLGAIHLNDSLVIKGCKKDRHAPLGGGYIWTYSPEVAETCFDGLDYLIALAGEKQVDVVLETPDPSGNLNFLVERYILPSLIQNLSLN